MKWIALIAASAISVVSLSAAAAPARSPAIENSPDILSPPQLKRPSNRASMPPLLVPNLAAAAAPTIEDVGDADSFGRNVTYLGLAQTVPVVVVDDCTGSDPEFERCVPANAAPATTSFNEAGLGSIRLPARATKSLVCFALTPFIQVQWDNLLAAPATATFIANARITIDNDVLDDPTLIDPATGLPFGGVLSLGLSTFVDFHTMQPAESDLKVFTLSRSCIGGVVSKRSLIENFGLSETQATQFFRRPMTFTFGSSGTVGLTTFATYFYGIRLYGD
ncbi:MAG TPA: hypothetical protein VFU13_20880 [Steroidobacteraceae bacterium]|nr:hypothetical protein [Steroidobacteraceae bacterium]